MKFFLIVFTITILPTIFATAQQVKSIKLRLVSRDLSREGADPLNIHLENPTTGKVLANKLQIFSWKQAFPPDMDMDLLDQNVTLQQLDSCLLKATMKTGRENYKFDCVLRIFFAVQMKPVKRRVSDMTFLSSPIPTNRLDSLIRPLK